MKTLLGALLLTFNVAAADEVAMVVALRGNVSTNFSELEQGSRVREGDTIRTEEKSFAVLQFFDGSKVTIRPDSQLVLDKYNPNEVQLDLLSGGLRVVTGTIAKSNPENYGVNTPVALMGVRGTEFSIQVID